MQISIFINLDSGLDSDLTDKELTKKNLPTR